MQLRFIVKLEYNFKEEGHETINHILQEMDILVSKAKVTAINQLF